MTTSAVKVGQAVAFEAKKFIGAFGAVQTRVYRRTADEEAYLFAVGSFVARHAEALCCNV